MKVEPITDMLTLMALPQDSVVLLLAETSHMRRVHFHAPCLVKLLSGKENSILKTDFHELGVRTVKRSGLAVFYWCSQCGDSFK